MTDVYERDKIKLWIDDVREPPSDDWKWAKTSSEAINALCDFEPIEVSFDHDLGGDDNSMAVVNIIEHWANEKLISKFPWKVHSMNPVGRDNIVRGMTKVEQIWEVNDKFLDISTISPRFCLSANSFDEAKTRAINALKQYRL